MAKAFVDSSTTSGTDWSLLIEIGRAYKRGQYPHLLPDDNVAWQVLRMAASCPDGVVAGDAQLMLLEPELAVEDRRGRPMCQKPAKTVVAAATAAIKNTPPFAFQRPVFAARDRPAVAQDDVGFPLRPQPQPMLEQQQPQPPPGIIDRQNVHDHGVNTAVSHNLRALHDANPKAAAPAEQQRALERSIDAVLNAPLSDLPPDDAARIKGDALAVLDRIASETGRHSVLGVTEREVLSMVWAAIESDGTDGLRETLAKQLASGVEGGSIVCSTGRIARVVSTLDGSGRLAADIRPMWAVKEELGTMAARMRNDGAGAAAFRDAAQTLYIHELGLSSDILSPVIDEYANAFDDD